MTRLIGDGVVQVGDSVYCWEDERGRVYADFSDYGLWAAWFAQRQGRTIERIKWNGSVEKENVHAFGMGRWQVGEEWIFGDCARR